MALMIPAVRADLISIMILIDINTVPSPEAPYVSTAPNAKGE